MALAPIKIVIAGVDQWSKGFTKLEKRTRKMARQLDKVGTKLTTSLTLPLLGAAAASIKFSIDLNRAMANVATLIPNSGKRINDLKVNVEDLAVRTGIVSTDLADGLYQVVSAFGDTADSAKTLEKAAFAAKAGVSSVPAAIDLLSAVTKGYGDTSQKMLQRVSDLSFKTVELGQTTFPELAASIGKVVPLAESLNIPVKNLFTNFATLTGVTGNTAEVATQLSAVMTGVLKPTAQLAKLSKKLGFESASSMVKTIGLNETLDKLSKAVGGSSDKLAVLLGRKEALLGALALTGSQATTFTEKLAKMGKEASKNATLKAYKEQTEGINSLGHKANTTKERIFRLARSIGARLLPVVEKVLVRITPFIDRMANASPAALDMAIKIGAVVAALGPFLVIVGKATALVGTVASALSGAGGVGAALVAITGPVGIAIGAFAVLAATTAYLWDEIQPIRKAFAEELTAAFTATGEKGEDAQSIFADLGATLKSVTKTLAPLTAGLVRIAIRLSPIVLGIKAFLVLLHLKLGYYVHN